MRRHAAEPEPQANRPVDRAAGRAAAGSEPRAHLDRLLVRAGRIRIAAERGHCMPERHARGRVVGVDSHALLEALGRLGVQALRGHVEAPSHVRRHVVGIQRKAGLVVPGGAPASRDIHHEQHMPLEHARRGVRRVDLDGPCVHAARIGVAAGQQRQVPELEVRKMAARIRLDCILKGGLRLFVPPQVCESMPRADEGQRTLLPATLAALAVLQDGLVRGARLAAAPRHLHESALYQLGGGPVDRAVVQAGAEHRFGRPARAHVVGILVRERVDVGVPLPEHGLEAPQAAPVYPPHQD